MKRIATLLLALLFVVMPVLPAAAETVTATSQSPVLLVKASQNPGVTKDIRSFDRAVNGNEKIYLPLPATVDMTHVTVTLPDKKTHVFDLTVKHTLTLKNGSRRQDCAIIGYQSDMPALYLTVDESKGTINAMNTSRDHSVNCYGSMALTVDSATAKKNGWVASASGAMEMRGRGNATWDGKADGKKPYQFKLDTKTNLLGMGAARTWILLANGMDASLIHNALALELAKNIGCPYTPEFRFVDLYLNGNYQGNYLLCEKVQVNEQRVNVSELNKNGKIDDTVNGGYLLEYNFGTEAPRIAVDTDAVGLYSLNIKSPDLCTTSQRTFISSFVTDMHTAIRAKNGKSAAGKYYTSYIDSTSASLAYWVNEIVKNGDFGYGSTYLYKDAGTVLYSGPVWDYDIAFGGIITPIAGDTKPRQLNLRVPTKWWLRENTAGDTSDMSAKTYVHYLFQHADFQKLNAQVYGGNVRASLLSMPDRVAYYRTYLQKAAELNFLRWSFPVNQKTYSWVASDAANWKQEMTFLQNWVGQRADWIDGQMKAECPDPASMKRLTVPVKLPAGTATDTATTTTAKKVTTTTTTKKNSSGTVAPTTKKGAAGTVVVTDTAGHAVTNQNGQTVTVAASVVTDAKGQTVTAANGAPVTVAAEAVTTVTTGQTTAEKQSATAPAPLLFAIGGVVLVVAAAGVTVFFIRKRRRPQETPAFRTKEDAARQSPNNTK